MKLEMCVLQCLPCGGCEWIRQKFILSAFLILRDFVLMSWMLLEPSAKAKKTNGGARADRPVIHLGTSPQCQPTLVARRQLRQIVLSIVVF